jgi:hypothetical protein
VAVDPLAWSLLEAQLCELLRSPDFKVACIQRLVAASIDAAEGLRVMETAIVRACRGLRGPVPRLAGRLLRALEAICAEYAEVRGLPYKKIVGPLVRGWPTWLDFTRQAGLTEEVGMGVLRDVLRRIPSTRWKAQSVERELFEELRHSFSVIAVAKGRDFHPP